MVCRIDFLELGNLCHSEISREKLMARSRSKGKFGHNLSCSTVEKSMLIPMKEVKKTYLCLKFVYL